MDQLIIKIVLITAFLIFGFVLIRAEASARSQAFRTFGLVVFLCAAILAVAFPGIVNELAAMVGVGRGTDLLLYAFIIVFVGQALSTARKRRAQEQRITELARKMALANPQWPASAPDPRSGEHA